MTVAGFDELARDADALPAPVPVVVAGCADLTVLEALHAASVRGWVEPILVGRAAEIERVANEAVIDLRGFRVIDTENAASAAVAEIRAGRARVLMKGGIATPDLMRAVLDCETGLRTGQVICQVVLMEIVPANRRFLLADTGVTIHPDLKKKLDIMRSTVKVAHALGEAMPRVALMAATESVVETMPETFEAVEITRRGRTGEFPGCEVQGPLSFDLAYNHAAADKKHIAGPVAGAADAMIFPNLVSANLTVKAIMYTSECRFGGVLCGTSSPVAFMSRADTTATRLHSLSLAVKLIDTSVDLERE
jgi:phosphate butyryltransferase